MSRIRCFLLEPTKRARVNLRRYTSHNAPDCCAKHPGKYSSHTASNYLCDEPAQFDMQGYLNNGLAQSPAHHDPHWPRQCACGYVFQESDEWQRDAHLIYARADTGQEMTLQEAEPGAMWYAWWIDQFHTPQGEHCLMVKTPGGEWNIDAQAINCTIPDDSKQERHHCWIRHGTPPDITVGKDGPTCSAGAGSIQCGSYHGFLRNGYLEG